MAKRLDSILIIDVESTCWEGAAPPNEESEIIEIGYFVLETGSLERTGSGSIIVRPDRSTVSEFCTKLTTLTQEQVDGGTGFSEACSKLKNELDSASLTWASYG